MEDAPDYSRILNIISSCRDVDKLTTFMINAQRKNVPEVRDAAIKQMDALLPIHKTGSFETAFWDMFATYRKVLLEHGRPIYRLSKARQMALDEGEVEALIHWVTHTEQVWAFDYLNTHGLSKKTAESLVLRFPKRFTSKLREEAKLRCNLCRPQLEKTV